MNARRMQLFGIAIAAGIASMAQAAVTDELSGNLFHQYNQPLAPYGVGVAVNNPQNMSGGQWVGNGPTYPAGGNSYLLDGNAFTGWGAGTFSGGGMCNVGFTQGEFSADQGSFTNTPFGAITTIRIWAQNHINDDSSVWISMPQQVKVAYTTANFNPGNGYNYNSGTLGVTPATWGTDGTITSVNGAVPTAPSDPAYATSLGWVDLTGKMTFAQTIDSHKTLAYADLSVSIPAGATSVLLSFGQTVNSPGGLNIMEVQAVAVPEPVTMGLLATAGAGLLIRRRRA